MKEKNDLDFALLEPGDLLLVANPTDPWFIRYALFWSHVGIVTEEGIIDAVREPRGELTELQNWGRVQCAPSKVYAANHDLLALRVKCSPDKRQAAVKYAQERIGLPYSPTLKQLLLGRRDNNHYSCGSLAWQAYREQGIDLAPLPFDMAVLPLFLLRSPHTEVVAYGSRYLPLQRSGPNLGLLLGRLWLRYLSQADITV